MRVLPSFQVHYHDCHTELCEIGAKFDSDKSPLRNKVTDKRHAHPYTLFYHSIFKEIRDKPIVIGELGILDGGSLRTWQEYFPQADIVGFEYGKALIKRFTQLFRMDRISLHEANVKSAASLQHAFKSAGRLYDIFIEDSTHIFEDQILVIKELISYIKPGGLLIIEDIFKKADEALYAAQLVDLMPQFQHAFFITMDHKRRRSTGWDNDKLLVLVKAGESPPLLPLYPSNRRRLTLITPCSRPENLKRMMQTIDFRHVERWVIVYDKKAVTEMKPMFDGHPAIHELWYADEDSISGNGQRNHALDFLMELYPDTQLIHFLDDDNIIHPSFFPAVQYVMTDGYFYTFNRGGGLKGDNVKVEKIDTVMAVVDFQLVRCLRWRPDVYQADGFYLQTIYNHHKDRWVYINNELCWRNILR